MLGPLLCTSTVFIATIAFIGFQIYQPFSFGNIMDDFKQFDISSCSSISELKGCKGLATHAGSSFAFAFCHEGSHLDQKLSGSQDEGAPDVGSKACFYSYDLKQQIITKLKTEKLPSNIELDILKVSIIEEPSNSLLHFLALSRRSDENVVEHFVHSIGTSSIEYYRTFQSEELKFMNSFAAVSHSSFFFTQGVSHHTGILNFLESASIVAGGRVMFRDDSGNYHEVARGLKYANGVALSSGRKHLYVAERGGAKLRVYEREETSNEIEFKESINLKLIPHNLYVDSASGHLYIAGVPLQLKALIHFTGPDGETKPKTSAYIVAKVSNETGEGRFFGRNYKVEPIIMDNRDTFNTLPSAVSDEKLGALLLTGPFALGGLVRCPISI